jgi:hypothetical protein
MLNFPGEAIGGRAFYYACGGACQDVDRVFLYQSASLTCLEIARRYSANTPPRIGANRNFRETGLPVGRAVTDGAACLTSWRGRPRPTGQDMLRMSVEDEDEFEDDFFPKSGKDENKAGDLRIKGHCS